MPDVPDQNPPKSTNPPQTPNYLEHIKTYYQNYFDVNTIFQVLDRKSFQNREFGFETVERGFMRNKSFANPRDLLDYLSLYHVLGFYSGATYDPPLSSTVKMQQTKWLKREVIFDFDLTEYDPVRTCGCKGRQVCSICWEFMTDAVLFLTDTLVEDFGQDKSNLVWVYSGGRGVHCWVKDPEWSKFTQNQRNAIVGYLTLIHDPEGNQRVDTIPKVIPKFRDRVYRLIIARFLENIPEQALDELELDKQAKAKFLKRIQALPSRHLQAVLQQLPRKINPNTFLSLALKYRYLRIDHKVTIDTRRLLRLPGSIHGKTGNLVQVLKDPASFTLDDVVHVTDIVNLKK